MLSKMILGSAMLIAKFRAGESAQERVEPGHPHYHLRNAGEPDHPDGGAPVGEPDHPIAGPDESSNLADQQQAGQIPNVEVEGGHDEKEEAPRSFPHPILDEINDLYHMLNRYYQGHPKLADINRRAQAFVDSLNNLVDPTNAEGTQPGAALAFDYIACARQLRMKRTEIKADRHLLLRQLVIRYLCEEPSLVLSGEMDMESYIDSRFEALDTKIDDIVGKRMTYVEERKMYLETCEALKGPSHGKSRAITIKFVDLVERRARKLMRTNITSKIICESQNDGDTCDALVLALEECYVCIHEGRKDDLHQAVMTQLVIARTHITSGYTQARRSDLSRAQSRMKPLH